MWAQKTLCDPFCPCVSSVSSNRTWSCDVRSFRAVVAFRTDLSTLSSLHYRVLGISLSVAKVACCARFAGDILQSRVGALRAHLASVDEAVIPLHYNVPSSTEVRNLTSFIAEKTTSTRDRVLSASWTVVVHGANSCLEVVCSVAVRAAGARRVELRT